MRLCNEHWMRGVCTLVRWTQTCLSHGCILEPVSLRASAPKEISACRVQWFSTYSRLLSDYMRRDKGIGMDLTLVGNTAYLPMLCERLAALSAEH